MTEYIGWIYESKELKEILFPAGLTMNVSVSWRTSKVTLSVKYQWGHYCCGALLLFPLFLLSAHGFIVTVN